MHCASCLTKLRLTNTGETTMGTTLLVLMIAVIVTIGIFVADGDSLP